MKINRNRIKTLAKPLALLVGVAGIGGFVSAPRTGLATISGQQTGPETTQVVPAPTTTTPDATTDPNFTTPDATVAPDTTTVPGTTTTADTAQANIVEVAANAGSFNTLVEAVQAANLEGTLAGPGPYTVFAPTDEAFAELPSGALDLLLRPENRDLLETVLTYHVVPAEVASNEIETGSVDTVGGGVAVRVEPDRVIVNDGSVIQPDIQANNGVIHAVNRVLMPREIRDQLLSQLGAS